MKAREDRAATRQAGMHHWFLRAPSWCATVPAAMANVDPPDGAAADRVEIVMQARRGEMSPEQAEAWAREKSQPPFASTPDAARWEPMTEPDWTLAMTAAWIMWRTPEAVRENWNAYRTECSAW